MEGKKYNPVRVVKGKPYALYCNEPSMTKQSFKEECDINEILKRAENGMDLTKVVNQRVAKYGDFSKVPDFQEAQNMIINANNMFMELGADVRERFHNDPAEMVEFLKNPENDQEAAKLGLIEPKKSKPEEGGNPPVSAPKGAPASKDEPPKGATAQ